MKTTIITLVLSCIISAQLTSQDIGGQYYVAPPNHSETPGNDSNPGTYSKPFGSWQKAFNSAGPGDTVYFRGGVWYPDDFDTDDNVTNVNNSGTANKYIHYFNYPGETPILDCRDIVPDNPETTGNIEYSTGVYIGFQKRIYMRGLTIRNVYQVYDSIQAQGLVVYGCTFMKFEKVTVHDIGGRGFAYNGGYAPDTTYFTNCDVYNCIDSLVVNNGPPDPGGWADGFQFANDFGSYAEFTGCRAWYVSDDGFNLSGNGFYKVQNCWSLKNGRLDGDGSGFKLNPPHDDSLGLTRVIINNIAASNNGSDSFAVGFTENNNGKNTVNMKMYNNTAYRNDWGYWTLGNNVGAQENNDYRNNIAYENLSGAKDESEEQGGGFLTDTCNTWNSNISELTSEDFLSLDINELLSPRKEDGSLPEVNFMKLSSTSNLIDAGVDVGLPFTGVAPDIGAWERDIEPDNLNKYPIIEITSPSEGARIVKSNSITINASTEDEDGDVNKVIFTANNVVIGEKKSPPWSIEWNDASIGNISLRAIAFDNKDATSYSSIVNIIVSSDNTKEADILLYPNPNNGLFSIYLSSPSPFQQKIEIVSIGGVIHYRSLIQANSIIEKLDLSSIPSGFYIITIDAGDGGLLTGKFLKI